MHYKINIIIPSVQLSEELIYCLEMLNHQIYKNFFVTIVLDFNNQKKLPKLKYKLNILVSGKKNMSYKRNLGVKKFKSNLIAFLDSDAYPNKNWLNIANNFFLKNKNKNIVTGGPSIPFPKQSYTQMLCYYAKRSYYVTGYLNFRKYKSRSRYCDWVESCNMLMKKTLYTRHSGMNSKIYLGEDKEFIERMKKNDQSVKVFFNTKLFIYHKERDVINFFWQRFVFGTDLFNIINFGNQIKSFQPYLPLMVIIVFIIIAFIEIYLNIKSLLIGFTGLIQFLIFKDIKKYLKDLKKILLSLILVNFANIVYVFGNIMAIMGIKNLINRKSYLKSRQNN